MAIFELTGAPYGGYSRLHHASRFIFR